MYLILSASLGPGVYLASTRNKFFYMYKIAAQNDSFMTCLSHILLINLPWMFIL
jgi:hypothetical protein